MFRAEQQRTLTKLVQQNTAMRKMEHAEAKARRKELEAERAVVAEKEELLEESGYTEMWQKDRSADAAGRLENLKELVRSMEEFENLQGFLEHISLVMDRDGEAGDESGESVAISADGAMVAIGVKHASR